jgi:hypothetical protein
MAYVNVAIVDAAICDLCGEERRSTVLQRMGDTMRIRLCLQCISQLAKGMIARYHDDGC